jgi:succinate dehydrogenase/fumarate reductase cytochrome b subunit
MNGREHLYWALMSFSISIFAFTIIFNYRDVGLIIYVALLVFIIISAILNEIANFIVSRVKKINRARNKEEGGKEIKIEPGESKNVNYLRAASYLFLGFLIILVIYVAIPASDIPAFIIAGYGGAFWGAFLPDLDKTIVDIRYHRNPVTHSGMIVFAIGIYALLAIPDEYISLMLFFIGLVMGTAAHVFCDNIESEGTLADVFTGFKWKECPGDIRMIREEYERSWLFFHGISLVILIVLMFFKFNLEPFMAYPVIWDGTSFVTTPVSDAILGFAIVYYVASFAMFIGWSSWITMIGKKKKPAKGKKNGGKSSTGKKRAATPKDSGSTGSDQRDDPDDDAGPDEKLFALPLPIAKENKPAPETKPDVIEDIIVEPVPSKPAPKPVIKPVTIKASKPAAKKPAKPATSP